MVSQIDWHMSAEVTTDTAFILYVALLVGILANIPAKP